VLKVENVTTMPTVYRYLALVKVAADVETRTHVMKLADVFRARVVDVAPESLILESTGTSDKIAGLLDVLRPFGLLEVAGVDLAMCGQIDPRRAVVESVSTNCQSTPRSRSRCRRLTAYGNATDFTTRLRWRSGRRSRASWAAVKPGLRWP
jgi:hypothetical protein